MVLTGAARSVTAKLFYQLGFDHPLFLTLLYLTGQALSLIPYNIWIRLKKGDRSSNRIGEESGRSQSTALSGHTLRSQPSIVDYATPDDDIEKGRNAASPHSQRRKSSVRFASDEGTSTSGANTTDAVMSSTSFADETKECDDAVMKEQHVVTNDSSTGSDLFCSGNDCDKKSNHLARANSSHMSSRILSMGRISQSTHGLPVHSRTRRCHQTIPWWLKPAVPAFFNLLNSAMRWASLVFVAASVAEMLISGMELVLSVCATRLVRGRKITLVRWLGVLVVTAGIILVGVFDTKNVADGESNDGASVNGQIIGILLILGQSVMSVIQDLTEEVFMQEAAFPPALLVGMEGACGIAIAIILYFPIAPLLGENPSDVASSLCQGDVIGLAIGWTLLVTVTGIFNIAATAVTSSMTRNVWKNMRTLLVWIIGLILFYATGSSNLGEGWYIPGSFLILLGYAVMCVGIFIYYGKGARAT
jgi:hypothetical protein